jgi:hypothetical protein
MSFVFVDDLARIRSADGRLADDSGSRVVDSSALRVGSATHRSVRGLKRVERDVVIDELAEKDVPGRDVGFFDRRLPLV